MNMARSRGGKFTARKYLLSTSFPHFDVLAVATQHSASFLTVSWRLFFLITSGQICNPIVHFLGDLGDTFLTPEWLHLLTLSTIS